MIDISRYTKIDDVTPFLKVDESSKRVTFIGKSATVYVPRRYEVYGLQDVGEYVSTLGMMACIFDDKYLTSLNFLAVVKMEPTEYAEEVIDGNPYLRMTFHTGDTFIDSTDVVRSADIIYAVWMEFITRGHPLFSFGYFDYALVFDRVREMTGSGIGVDRSLFELVVAHLTKDANDLFKPYRLTDMTGPFRLVPLRSVSYAPDSTSARLIGSYREDGYISSLNTEATESQPFENLLRGFPNQDVGEGPVQPAEEGYDGDGLFSDKWDTHPMADLCDW